MGTMAQEDDPKHSGVYLDVNATTRVANEVVDTVTSVMVECWGNPSSSHHQGTKAKMTISRARQRVADMIGGDAADIIFTSGGTEANNMVLNTFLGYFPKLISDENESCEKDGEDSESRLLPHFIISNVEHDSISKPLRHYHDTGLADLTIIPVSPATGQVEVADIMAAILPTTCLVSLMLANNETGIIQPVKELCERVKHLTRHPGETRHIYIHTDAAQAIGKIRVDVRELRVDYLTIAGHKFYGPRIGALYTRNLGEKTPLLPLLFGGGQERGFRSGTENTPMIAGLGKACELVTLNLPQYCSHMTAMREYLEERLHERFGSEVTFNVHYPGSQRLPNTCSVSFRHPLAKGHEVLKRCHVLEASTGAACHTSNGVSSVLLASGVAEDVARNAVRLSVGRETTYSDIDRVVDDLGHVLDHLDTFTATM